MTYPRIAIIYLSYHCEPYLARFLDSISTLTYPRDKLGLIIVDNPHPRYGSSAEFIQRDVGNRQDTLPLTVVLENSRNDGFAQGHNRGARHAEADGCEYIWFQNQDGYLAPDCLEPMVEALNEDRHIAVAQPLILLHPKTEQINSAGNALHLLGFGYCQEYRSYEADIALAKVFDVPYCSGASLVLRTSFGVRHGFWDKDFFVYHEDTDLSLRARLLGWRAVVVRDARAYHEYEFARSVSKFYWIERNRCAVLLIYYRWRTLVLLLPGLVAAEMVLFLFALRGGWWREKLSVWRYWMSRKHWTIWLAKRRVLQSVRVVADRDLLQMTTGRIAFQEEAMQGLLVRGIINPLCSLWCRIVKKIVVW